MPTPADPGDQTEAPNAEVVEQSWRTNRSCDSLAWTNWPLFAVGLVQRGYKDEEIQKILGGNVLRVARAALIKLERVKTQGDGP